MQAQQYTAILDEAGVKIDSLAAAAAAFIGSYPVHATYPAANALTNPEEVFLSQGGALGVAENAQPGLPGNVAVVAGEYALMVDTGYSQRDTAKILEVTTSRVRQRIDRRSLYAIDGPAGRVCPRFQFMQNATLPGLEKVLAAISTDAHPVAVQRFFLGSSPDLFSETLDEGISPRDWLMTGHPIHAVTLLAREL